MKKTILLFLFIVISITFISCSKNAVINESTRKIQDNSSTTIITTIEDNTNTTKQNSQNNSSENRIKKMYLDYNGFKIDIDVTDEMTSELSEFENCTTVPDTKLSKAFATIYAVYSDKSEELFGTIYIGNDGAYYLKCENNPNKDAAVKLADDFLNKSNKVMQ